MDEAAEGVGLIRAAIASGTSGCLCWKNEELQRRVRSNSDLKGLTPEGIEDCLYEYISGGGAIRQKTETRDNWRGSSDFVYEVLINVSGFPRDLYIELILDDPVDEDCPVAIIVSAHLSSYERRKR